MSFVNILKYVRFYNSDIDYSQLPGSFYKFNNKFYIEGKEIINSENINNFISTSIVGPIGPQGPQGNTGPQGPTGPTGPIPSIEYTAISVSGSLTIGSSSFWKIVNASGTITIVLPKCSTVNGKLCTIKNSGTGTINIAPFPEDTIDSGLNVFLTLSQESKTLYCTGSEWLII